MKIRVEGIEEIEITDPKGLCNPIPVQQQPRGLPIPQPGQPFPPGPDPFGTGGRPWGDVTVPHTPIYRRNIHDPDDPFLRSEWGIGDPTIQQVARQTDAAKEGQDGNQNTQ